MFCNFISAKLLKFNVLHNPTSSQRYDTVDLVLFARFQFSRISIIGQIREFKNLKKKIIMRAQQKKVNLRILNFLKSFQFRN